MVKIKFKGVASLYYMLPCFVGKVNTGDIIETTKECYESELKEDTRWELVKETKKTKGAE
jgi:hypothetical protein